jgi:hypothetical protein
MLSSRRSFVIGFMAALILAGVFLGGYALGERQGLTAEASGPAFALLPEVQSILDRSFMGETPEPQAREYAAIHGLVSAYKDRFTVFVEPAPREMERRPAGPFRRDQAYLAAMAQATWS